MGRLGGLLVGSYLLALAILGARVAVCVLSPRIAPRSGASPHRVRS